MISRMLNAVKVSCLFIGAVVGAGFATGREVILFFGNSGSLTPLIAGLLMGCASGVFLFVGKFAPSGGIWRVLARITDFLVFCAMVITFAVMCSAAEQLFSDAFGVSLVGLACGLICAIASSAFGVSLVGLACGLICAIASSFEMKLIKNISFALVIALTVSIAVMYFMCDKVHGQYIDLFSAFKYCGMNMLTGGCLIKDEGKRMKNGEIFLSSLITAVICALLLVMVYAVASVNAECDMPVYEFAMKNHAAALGGILIVAAILSTLLGAGRAACTYMEGFFSSSAMPVIFLCSIAVIGYSTDFSAAVDTYYPVIGVFGSCVCIVYALSFAAETRRKLLFFNRRI